MGYESKIYIMHRREWRSKTTNETMVYGGEVASFELYRLPYNGSSVNPPFTTIFSTPVDFDFFPEDDDTVWKEDRYGDPIKMTDVKTVLDWIEREMTVDSYWRYKPLAAMLRELMNYNNRDDDSLVVLHFGH